MIILTKLFLFNIFREHTHLNISLGIGSSQKLQYNANLIKYKILLKFSYCKTLILNSRKKSNTLKIKTINNNHKGVKSLSTMNNLLKNLVKEMKM